MKRQNFTKFKLDMAEVYSPPCMCATARKLRLKASFSLDLTVNDESGEPWNLFIESVQRKVLGSLEDQKPWLVEASPPCTMFSTLQHVTLEKRNESILFEEVQSAIKHFSFAVFHLQETGG